MIRRRVVITGLGAVSALGEGAPTLFEAWLTGRSALEVMDFGAFKPAAGHFSEFNPDKFVTNRKSIKVMARDIQMAVAAARLAVDDSGVTPSNPDLSGICVGAGVLNHELDELASSMRSSFDEQGRLSLKKFGEEGVGQLFPLWLLKYLPNMPACHISIHFDLRGPSNTLTTGASSGLQAVEEAARVIERGTADWMLAGGAESKTNPVGLAQYAAEKVLAQEGDPKKVYRPLDQKASGLVPGEGAAFVVLEEYEHAKKRGAKIYAEITGYGSSSADGQAQALKSALTKAGIKADAVQFVQASALGVPQDDQAEMRAIDEIFQENSKPVLVSGTKPLTGFTGSASGTLDLIASAMAVHEQKVGPLLNFEKPAVAFKAQVISGKTLQTNIDYAVSTAFGFNGQACAVVLKKVSK